MNHPPPSRRQAGFTLVELVMVITILGILSAVAVPKFVDLGGDARKAAVQSWAGAIRSAMGMAHSTYIAMGTSPASVTVDGVVIAMNGGYPIADAGRTGIFRALANTDTSDLVYSADGTSAVFHPSSAPNGGAACRVTYTLQPPAPPQVAIDYAGC
jgi:MSHA pilin protein MshA